MRLRTSSPGLLVVLAASAVAGCGGSGDKDATAPDGTSLPKRILDTQVVATSIKASVQQQRGKRVHVVCPQAVPQQKGFTFTCVATSKATGTTNFTVQQVDDQGHVTYAAG